MTSNLKIKGLLVTKSVCIGLSWKYHSSNVFLATNLFLSYNMQLPVKITNETLQRSSNVSYKTLSTRAELPPCNILG